MNTFNSFCMRANDYLRSASRVVNRTRNDDSTLAIDCNRSSVMGYFGGIGTTETPKKKK